MPNKNYLDAVIGLPANLFYGTTIPACILIFKKCRVHDDNILFIDASAHFEKRGNQNYLTDEHVEKIVEIYAKRETFEKYSYVAQLSEVTENGYNLNIPRYVDTFEGKNLLTSTRLRWSCEHWKAICWPPTPPSPGFCHELSISSPVGSILN